MVKSYNSVVSHPKHQMLGEGMKAKFKLNLENTKLQYCLFYLGSGEEVIYEKEGLGSFAINQDKAVIWLTDISNNKLIEINII